MKVNDVIEKVEKELTTEELVDLIANHNRQVDLIFAEKKTDEDGYLTWDLENWTSVDGKRLDMRYAPGMRTVSIEIKLCKNESCDFPHAQKYPLKLN